MGIKASAKQLSRSVLSGISALETLSRQLVEYRKNRNALVETVDVKSKTSKMHRAILAYIVHHAEEIVGKKIAYAGIEVSLEEISIRGSADFLYMTDEGTIGVIEAEWRSPTMKKITKKYKKYGRYFEETLIIVSPHVHEEDLVNLEKENDYVKVEPLPYEDYEEYENGNYYERSLEDLLDI